MPSDCPDLSRPTGYTGDSLASDLGNRSAAPHGFVEMGRYQIGHYQFQQESCRSRPRTSILLVHPVFARSHKSNAPQLVARRRRTGSGGDVRELLTGDDPSAMLSHRWRKDPAGGEIFSTRRAWEMTRASLAGDASQWHYGYACRYLPGGAAPPAGIAPRVWPPHSCLGEATFFES